MLRKLLAYTELVWCNGILEHTMLPTDYVWYSCTYAVKIAYNGPRRYHIRSVWADGLIMTPSQYQVTWTGKEHRIIIRDLNLIPYGGLVPVIVAELQELPC